MLNDIEGAAESILNHGTTIAVVRHPFLRLYSGLSLHIQIKESFPNLDQKGFTHTNPSVIHEIIHLSFTRKIGWRFHGVKIRNFLSSKYFLQLIMDSSPQMQF